MPSLHLLVLPLITSIAVFGVNYVCLGHLWFNALTKYCFAQCYRMYSEAPVNEINITIFSASLAVHGLVAIFGDPTGLALGHSSATAMSFILLPMRALVELCALDIIFSA